MKANKIKYIHTMNQQPATYFTGEQICFASKGRRGAVRLCDTLDQIKLERKQSEKWRKSKGFPPANERWQMGWVNVLIP